MEDAGRRCLVMNLPRWCVFFFIFLTKSDATVRLGLRTSSIEVVHQVINRTGLYPPLLPEPQTPISPRHPSTHAFSLPLYLVSLVHQLGQDTRERLPGQFTKLNRSLRMPFPLPHPALPRSQRKDMARSSKGVRSTRFRSKRPTRECAIVGRYARRDGGV